MQCCVWSACNQRIQRLTQSSVETCYGSRKIWERFDTRQVEPEPCPGTGTSCPAGRAGAREQASPDCLFHRVGALTRQAAARPVLLQQKPLRLRDPCLLIANPVSDHMKLWNHMWNHEFVAVLEVFFFPFTKYPRKHVCTSAFLMQSPS